MYLPPPNFLLRSIALCVCLFAYAQAFAGEPPSRQFTTSDGIPGTEIYCLLQDADGYLWLGTNAGACRFDGTHFQTFSTEQGLGGNHVRAMAQDAAGRIWFMPQNGRNTYLLRHKIHHATNSPELAQLQANARSMALLTGPDESLLWPGSDGEILALDSAGEVSNIQLPNNEHIQLVLPAGTSGYYIASQRTVYLLESNRLNPVSASWQALLPSLVSSCAAPNNQLYLATANVLYLTSDTGLIAMPLPAELHHSQLRFVQHEANAGLWLGTTNGVWRFPGGNLANTGTQYLPGREVTQMLTDKEGNFWFATRNSGLHYFYTQQVMCFDARDGLSSTEINKLTAGPNGKLLVANITGEIQQYTPLQGFGQPVDTQTDSVAAQHIQAMLWDSTYLHVLTEKSLLQIGPNGSQQTVGPGGSAMAVAPWNPALLLVGNQSGLWLCGANSTPQQALALPEVTALCKWQNGLVAGCRNGLFFIDQNLRQTQLADSLSALQTGINGLATDAQNRLWVATNGMGVVLIEQDRAYRFGTKQQLPSSVCHAVFAANEKCWVATNKGLARIAPGKHQQWDVSTFTQHQGLPHNHLLDVVQTGATVWLATQQGLARFTEGYLRPGNIAPTVRINNVLVNDEPQDLEKLIRADGGGSVKINFNGISLGSFGALSYKYRISTLTKDWLHTNSNTVELLALPDGYHTFEVKAASADGIWSAEAAKIGFDVQPPYWKTWWFRSLLVLIFILLLIASFRFSITSAIEDEQQKRERQRQISELQMQALRAQMNPHFIFNSLNSIQHFIATKDEKAALRYLSRFARLVRMVLENSRHSEISLARELEALGHYMELELLRVDHAFTHTINVQPSIETERLAVPPMLIQPYVENAIWHGLMLRDAGGRVDIDISLEDNQLRIIVQDNGIGRERSGEINRKKRKHHRSIGMHATRERLELIGLVHEGPASTVVTQDLYDEAGEAAGTRVVLLLQLRTISEPEPD